MSKDVTLVPLLNEKTYELSKSKNVYVFKIPNDANKHTVARAVTAQFDVEVIAVNTLNVQGKRKRIMSITGKRSVNTEGKRVNTKKAYVTLKEGNSLPFFEAVEEAEEKRTSTQEKFDKVAEKQAKKEAKTESKPSRRILGRAKKEDKAEDK
ncbi:MAG TPA: 50S ribosomal protein L23 [Candidatus Saccharimonadales bacterium]